MILCTALIALGFTVASDLTTYRMHIDLVKAPWLKKKKDMHRYEALIPGEVRADSRRTACVATVHCLSRYMDLGDELSWYRTQGDREIRQSTLITKATEI